MTTSTQAGSLHAALLLAAGAAALALVNHTAARQAERRHPPKGRFIEVDGTRLHYTDEGAGPPVVLLHGNVVSAEDWRTSGVSDRLRERHRVIAFDRPGFGHSDRPRGRIWTAGAQAELLYAAIARLGLPRPIVIGHSWGTLPALFLAARYPDRVGGLVLVSGYYFWTLRPDVLLVALTAMPVLGDLLRYTLSPLLGRLAMPLLKHAMFSPAPVAARFHAEFSDGMALRPSQIRATSVDGALMIPGVLDLHRMYGDIAMPVAILAGDGDKVVFRRNAERLHAGIPGSNLRVIEGAGHMLHHTAPHRVAEAVDWVAGMAVREPVAHGAQHRAEAFAAAG